MSFQITEKKTPFLAQQPEGIQDAAKQFVLNYTSKNSVKVRAAWGALLEQIQNGLVCVRVGKGDKAHTLDGEQTFTAICRELGIARSSAYSYIATHVAVSNYPEVIQRAAEEAHLNLALPHVMAEYQKLTVPTSPTLLELKGIIAQLQEAKPAKKPDDSEPLTQEEFKNKLSKLVSRAKRSGLKFNVTLETLINATYTAHKTYAGREITIDDGVVELQRTWANRMSDTIPADITTVSQ